MIEAYVAAVIMDASDPLHQLSTPAALIDEARLDRNIDTMAARAAALGVRLRPHVKTTKCVPVAERQRAAGASGITVSTLKEAEQFFAAGFDDILYAVGIVPHKLAQAQALAAHGCRLGVVVDSLAVAQAVARALAAPGAAPLEVWIEIDCDGHRAGVLPESELLLAIGQALRDEGTQVHGVMTHAGESYAENTPAGLQRIAEQERSRCVRAAERLRAAGFECAEVSVGSTPTALSAEHLRGVTELRAGVYAFQDLVMCNIGVARPDDVALSVLATVIGHQLEKGWVMLDAGWMAMSRDQGTRTQAVDYGYGALCDLQGHQLPGWVLHAANQEHGIASYRGNGQGPSGADLERQFPIGSRWRVLPNHACATGAQHDHYTLLGRDGQLQRWERFNGW